MSDLELLGQRVVLTAAGADAVEYRYRRTSDGWNVSIVGPIGTSEDYARLIAEKLLCGEIATETHSG